jgi:hypothetical protein
MASKSDVLKKAIEDFISSESNDHVSEFMLLFISFNSVMKQGSGLLWTQVEDVLKEVFEEE